MHIATLEVSVETSRVHPAARAVEATSTATEATEVIAAALVVIAAVLETRASGSAVLSTLSGAVGSILGQGAEGIVARVGVEN